MQLDRITAALPTDVPLVTVVFDVTREGETGDQAVLTRWRDLRRSLETQGGDGATLDALDDRVRAISRAAGQGGRMLVAARGEVLLDRGLRAAPTSDEALVAYGTDVLALARVADEHVRYLLATVDRSGVDIAVHDWVSGAEVANQSLEGGHDVLTKAGGGRDHGAAGAGGGGRVPHGIDTRVEDSWERNAEVVAAELERVVGEHRPELVVLTGDVRARALVVDELGRAVRKVLVLVDGGSRAEGVRPESLAANVQTVLDTYRDRRRADTVDHFRQVHGQDGAAITGRDDVLDVLRKGQVAELLVTEAVAGPPSSLAGGGAAPAPRRPRRRAGRPRAGRRHHRGDG
ncbi:MAG: baeRF2 domain-containing protein [Georgenia sp.]